MPLTWLVTGCSSGFGAAFVPAIVTRGDNCIASGRSADTRLAHLKSTGAAILDLDVTDTQQIIDEQIKKAIEIYGGIDVLVNNAGYMMSGFVEEMTCVLRRFRMLLLSIHHHSVPSLLLVQPDAYRDQDADMKEGG